MAFTLHDVLAPMTLSQFRETHYERKPLLIRRDAPGYYDELITFDEFSEFLGEANLVTNGLRLSRDDQELDPRYFTYSGVAQSPVHKEAIFALFYEGYTVVQYNYDRHRGRVRHLCHTVEKLLNADSHANIYLSPRRTPGFYAHWDNDDVFILQFAGTKEWTLYDSPVTLPSRRNYYPGSWQRTEPSLRAVLSPGDMLYIPRGFVHEACPQSDLSAHLTLGAFPTTYADLLLRLLENTDCNEWLRRSLPPDYETSREWVPEFVDRVKDFVASADVASAATSLYDDFCDRRLPDATGRLADYRRLPSLELTTKLGRKTSVFFRMLCEDDSVVLRFGNKRVAFAVRHAESLRFITAATGEFTVGQIPGYTDDEDRLALCRKLVAEGFLGILS